MSTLSLSSADAALRGLTDRAELGDLVTRLGRWLDGGARDEPAGLFVADVRVSTPGGEATGVEPLVAQARRNHAVPTQHVIANVLTEVDGDAASLSANLVVTFVDGPGRGEHHQHGETYAFDAVRTAAGWRLSSITVRPVWHDA
ncbi:MAG TPA: nuclear transport factor 2 family protein [Baekduia sp.]